VDYVEAYLICKGGEIIKMEIPKFKARIRDGGSGSYIMTIPKQFVDNLDLFGKEFEVKLGLVHEAQNKAHTEDLSKKEGLDIGKQ